MLIKKFNKMNNLLINKFTRFGVFIIIVMGVVLFSQSCDSDDMQDEFLYTFQDQMIGQYLRDSADYAEFSRLLDTTKVMGLLNSYGSYTCFAPSNEAMKNFYALKGKQSLSDFSYDSLQLIAYDHLINGTVVTHTKFGTGRLPQLTMSDRYISVSHADGNVYLNGSSKVLIQSVTLHNGVLHKIDEVLNPTRDGVVEAISKEEDFTIFYEALIATGMADSLLKIEDDTYVVTKAIADLVEVKKEDKQWMYHEIPLKRKYGYTVFMESNETMNRNGIIDLESLKAYAASVYDIVYPEDKDITDVTNRKNSLNRFVSYHLVNKQLSKRHLIDLYDTGHMLKDRDMFEYIETMCPNTLIEIKKDRMLNQSNIINYLRETGQSIQLGNLYDGEAINGVYHEVNDMLVYSREVDTELSTKRLRFDSSSFFPELTNNGMRGARYLQNTDPEFYEEQSLHWQLPRGYIDRISSSEQTVVGYLSGYHRFQNYQGDEIFLNASSGKLYDFEIITPPIPKGTYEVRMGYLSNGKRGVAQLYFDGAPCDVPLNLNNLAGDFGWERPGSVATDPFGFENDKVLRNNNFMKGPACYKVITSGWSGGENARYSDAILRRIIGTFIFHEAGHHVFKVKGLSGGEFMFDYMEFVPTSVLESEDIY